MYYIFGIIALDGTSNRCRCLPHHGTIRFDRLFCISSDGLWFVCVLLLCEEVVYNFDGLTAEEGLPIVKAVLCL
jgi:hypothetical protein